MHTDWLMITDSMGKRATTEHNRFESTQLSRKGGTHSRSTVPRTAGIFSQEVDEKRIHWLDETAGGVFDTYAYAFHSHFKCAAARVRATNGVSPQTALKRYSSS